MQNLGIDVLFKGTNMLRLLGGLWVSLRISLIAVGFSIVLGIPLGMLMTKDSKIVKAIARLYLEIVRVMPQMVLLFIVFFGTTRIFGWNLNAELASVIVFSFWGCAEMSDLVRGAFVSIPKHQYESARALGMNSFTVFFFVILPQTLRRLLPTSINLVTRMIKTTSLVVFVGVIEVVKIGQQIIEANRLTIPTASIAVYGVIFFMYFIVCWPLSLAADKIEKRERS